MATDREQKWVTIEVIRRGLVGNDEQWARDEAVAQNPGWLAASGTVRWLGAGVQVEGGQIWEAEVELTSET